MFEDCGAACGVGEAEVTVQWLDRRLMDNPFHIALCTSEQAFQRELRRLKIAKERWPKWILSPQSAATTHYFATADGRRVVIVAISRKRSANRLETYATLVHEAVHVWQWIKEDIHESEPSAEFEAYSIQRLSLNLMGAYG